MYLRVYARQLALARERCFFDQLVVPDDVPCCPTALEEKAASMFGMERAMFVPSGTMGNLISG